MWGPSRNLVNKVTKKSVQWLNTFEKIKLLLWQETEYSMKLTSERIFKIYFSSFTSKGFSCSTIELINTLVSLPGLVANFTVRLTLVHIYKANLWGPSEDTKYYGVKWITSESFEWFQTFKKGSKKDTNTYIEEDRRMLLC